MSRLDEFYPVEATFAAAGQAAIRLTKLRRTDGVGFRWYARLGQLKERDVAHLAPLGQETPRAALVALLELVRQIEGDIEEAIAFVEEAPAMKEMKK